MPVPEVHPHVARRPPPGSASRGRPSSQRTRPTAQLEEQVVERGQPDLVAEGRELAREVAQRLAGREGASPPALRRDRPARGGQPGRTAAAPRPAAHDHDVLPQEVAEHALRRAVGDHAAAGQHGEHVAQPLRLVHVVRGEDHAEPVGAEPLDELPHGHARLGIEPGGGLVQEEQSRPVDDRARDHEPSTEAARQDLGLGVGVCAEGEAVDQLVDALAQVLGPRPEVAGRHRRFSPP